MAMSERNAHERTELQCLYAEYAVAVNRLSRWPKGCSPKHFWRPTGELSYESFIGRGPNIGKGPGDFTRPPTAHDLRASDRVLTTHRRFVWRPAFFRATPIAWSAEPPACCKIEPSMPSSPAGGSDFNRRSDQELEKMSNGTYAPLE